MIMSIKDRERAGRGGKEGKQEGGERERKGGQEGTRGRNGGKE
jgi:hypothetical protein